MSQLRVPLSILLTFVSVAIPVSPEDSFRPGYLVTFSMQGESVTFDATTEIENFVPARHGSRSTDWRVRLLDEDGQVQWEGSTINPRLFSPPPPATRGVAIIVRVPLLPNATVLTLHDTTGKERARVSIDDEFGQRAKAARAEFLSIAEANSEAIRVRPASGRKTGFEPAIDRRSLFEKMGESGRAAMVDRATKDLEVAEVFGLGAANLAAASGKRAEWARDVLRVPSQRKTSSLRKASYIVSGVVLDTETSLPVAGAVLFADQYDSDRNFQEPIGSFTTGQDGGYSFPVDEGWVLLSLSEVTGALYAAQWHWVDVNGSSTFDVPATPAVVVSGVVTNRDSAPVPGAHVMAVDNTWAYHGHTDASGGFSVVVPRNKTIAFSVHPPPPYVSPQSRDGLVFPAEAEIDWVLDRGWVVSGVVKDGAGNAIPNASVLLRHAAPSTSDSQSWWGATDEQGEFTFVARRDVAPPDYVLCVHAEGYVRHFLGFTVTDDISLTISLEEGLRVDGVVRDQDGAPLASARVRALDGTNLVTSASTNSAGEYALNLGPGVYNFEVLPWSVWSSDSGSSQPYFPLTETGVSVSESTTRDFVLSRGAGVVEIILEMPSAYYADIRYEILAAGKVIAAYYGGRHENDNGTATVRYGVTLDSGTYDVAVTSIGHERVVLPDVSVAGTPTVRVDMPPRHWWHGVLRDGDGSPVAGSMIFSCDDLGSPVAYGGTAGDGSFDVPISDHGFFVAYVSESGNSIFYSERFGDIDGGRTADLNLESFQPLTDSGDVVSLLYGDETSDERYTIAIIGDGYTTFEETYSDTNENGVWDGILFNDYNQNGILDSGERYSRYGETDYPEYGTDPTEDNEPFVDLNGDGFPNLDDQAIFDANSAAVLRALFGHDFWKNHRDLFNVYTIRVSSNQAGYDIYDDSGGLIIERDTVFGSGLWLERSLLNADYPLVSQYVYEHVPEAETMVLLINQPVRGGRANSFITMAGGADARIVNLRSMAHEMGHNVGGLSDEYSEFSAVYEGEEGEWINVTTVTDPDLVPWSGLIDPFVSIPSVLHSTGIGLFEGAHYHTGGAYRPTTNCMMAGTLRFCPVCLRALQQRVATIRRDLPGTPVGLSPRGMIGQADPDFQWTSVVAASHYEIEIERVDEPGFLNRHEVFDRAFSLASPIPEEADYRWRVRAGVDSVKGDWSGWYEFSIPDLSQVPTGLSVSGPTAVSEGTSASYAAIASWGDGSSANVTYAVKWTEDSEVSDIDHAGVLTTMDVESRETVTITAEFPFGSTTMIDTFDLYILDADQVDVFADGFESGDMHRWSYWTPG